MKWWFAGVGLAAALSVPAIATAGGFGRQYGSPDGWYGYAVSVTNQHKYGPLDGWYGYAVALTNQQQSTVIDGRSPDTRDAALNAQAAESIPVDGRSPDTIDAANAAQIQLSSPVDGRSPDTIDAAALAHSPVVTVVGTPGFHWGDFGIGGGVALALAILLMLSTRFVSNRKGGSTPLPTA